MVSVYQGLGQGPFALIDTTQLPTSDLSLPGLQSYNHYSGPQPGQQMLQMGPSSALVLQPQQQQQQHHSGPLHIQSMDSNTYVLSSASLAGVAVSTGTNATNLTNVTNLTDSSGSNVMQQGEQRTSVTLSMSGNDMQTVTMHIYAIQTMSGTEFSSQAVGPGLFYLTLTGTASQVAMAQNLVGAVLTQGGAGLAGYA